MDADTCSESKCYDYEQLICRPYISPESDIAENLLTFVHSFGYDSCRQHNLQLLDEHTLAYIAGNFIILLDVRSKEQKQLYSCSGGGIGAIVTHPARSYFAVAEKGDQPNIIIYTFPSLQPYRVLTGGTTQAYSTVSFNSEGSLLVSVGSSPDYTLTLWAWHDECVMLKCKAFSQDVYNVSFSPYNSNQLTTSGSGHIRFWTIASTFTGLKLQGVLGRFSKTPLTDVYGFVELPDGKVVSGCEWGNMLLWDGDLIKVQISRKENRTCHTGAIQQLVVEEGELITLGVDGAVRTWDLETVVMADSIEDTGLFHMEPMNELVVGRNVSLTSMVKNCVSDSSLWFAQDSNGAIWKLDLSFSNMTQDPQCLFSFHGGPIQDMDLCDTKPLMATTALDRSVRVIDILSKTEVCSSRFTQGGTALCWAPSVVPPEGALLAVGFEDGVVRLLELSQPLQEDKNSQLILRQAFKPHEAAVSSIAFQHSCNIMATGGVDSSVFFFSVGNVFVSIGFIRVPGPVQELQWSPQSHERSTLLILCQSGHVVEAEAPETTAPTSSSTYELHALPSRHFSFCSIKARIKRDAEVSRRNALKEKKEEQNEPALEEEEEEDLPPLYEPHDPSPLLCGFYSQPGTFWLSMGGYDSGFLYHCCFSEEQCVDPASQQDEPFAFIPLEGTDDNPVCSLSLSEGMLLCGLQAGQVRVYPLESPDTQLSSLHDFWSLSAHDNDNGSVRRVRCSYDGAFILTAAEDGNIFMFCVRNQCPQEVLKQASPSTAAERVVQDIEDPNAYSIETAKQRAEQERLHKEAEQRKQQRRKHLAELTTLYTQLQQQNLQMPESVRLQPEELELHPRFRHDADEMKSRRIQEVRRELAWQQEWHNTRLRKLQERFYDCVDSEVVSVVAFESEHRVCTYRVMKQRDHMLKLQTEEAQPSERRVSTEGAPGASDREVPQEDVPGSTDAEPRGFRGILSHEAEKQRRRAQKAEQAKAKINKRKQEWAQLLAQKPPDNWEDPEDLQDIQMAWDNMGDFKLKTAEDFSVPKHLRMNPESKRAQLAALEQQVYEKKTAMNKRVLSMRDAKMQLISHLRAKEQQLHALQELLPPDKRCVIPTIPKIRPEETPDKKLHFPRATLLRLHQHSHADSLLELLHTNSNSIEQEEQEQEQEQEDTHSTLRNYTQVSCEESKVTELEQDMRKVEQISQLYLQDTLLSEMQRAVVRFDAELRLLRHDKLTLDVHMKLADMQHITLFQELLLLKEFEKRENILQETLHSRMEEAELVKSRLEECKLLLEKGQQVLSRLQEQEKTLTTMFTSSLGENNKFSSFLTKVFRKKIKPVKRKEEPDEQEEEEDSDESEELSEWDEEEEGSTDSVDDNVCPPHCDPELFENTKRLREQRLHLEELMGEEKKSVESLKKEFDSLVKKEKNVQSRLKAAEGDLNLLNRQKQQKLNEVDVAVPLRLHQIEFVKNGSLPNQLSSALVVNTAALVNLNLRITQLHQEKIQQKELFQKARLRHKQLLHERKDMEATICDMDMRCQQLMQMKFGRQVDIEALQTLSGNLRLEELQEETALKQDTQLHQLRVWQGKINKAQSALTEQTKEHTERLNRKSNILTETKTLEDKLESKPRKTDTVFLETHRAEQEELRKLVELQEQEIEALKQEINTLSHKRCRMTSANKLHTTRSMSVRK